MVEQQVGVEVGVTDFEVDLTPDERESLPEFQQKLLDVIGQQTFQITFATDVRSANEVEEVWVAGRLLRQVGVRRRQGVGEVRNGLPGPLVELRVDVVDQDVPAPTLVDRHLGVP